MPTTDMGTLIIMWAGLFLQAAVVLSVLGTRRYFLSGIVWVMCLLGAAQLIVRRAFSLMVALGFMPPDALVAQLMAHAWVPAIFSFTCLCALWLHVIAARASLLMKGYADVLARRGDGRSVR